MTTYLGKSCSFGLPRVPFVNCRQFMYLVISLLVLRAGCGIWLYQFLIIAYLFTFHSHKWFATEYICLNVSNLNLSFLLPVLFALAWGLVSFSDLPSYFRGNPGNRRDRPTSFGWDVVIRRILNKRSNQDKVLLHRACIWITIEIFFLCKFKCTFTHRFIITFLI